MLNEERVKHMIKLAFYEAKGGKEDLKAGFRYKQDYIAFHTFWSAFCMTIAYAALVFILSICFMQGVWGKLSSKETIVVAVSFFGIYLVLLNAYIRYAKKVYKKKHAGAYHRIKQFKDELEKLEAMYEMEDHNE